MTDEPTGPTLTRYHILTSKDEGRTWTFLDSVDASNRDTALRRYFGTPPDDEILGVAVSESSFRPTIVKSRTTTSLSEVAMPSASEPAAEQVAVQVEPDSEPVAAI